jgi:phosphonate transport system ATP-binding protein
MAVFVTQKAPGNQAPGATPQGDPVLRVRGLCKKFRDGPPVLHGVDLDVHPGEVVVVLGANGSGKSTLLRCAVRLLDADDGSVWLCGNDLVGMNGRELRAARRQAAMVFQQIHLVRRRSAIDNVAFGALGRMPASRSFSRRMFPEDVRDAAVGALERVGLSDKAYQRADTLSGGQAQRVAIARALCQRASVILADEPVSSLDPHASEVVMQLLAEIAHKDGLAVACVLHQPDLARRHADRIVGIHKGVIAFNLPPASVTDQQISSLYEGEVDEDGE